MASPSSSQPSRRQTGDRDASTQEAVSGKASPQLGSELDDLLDEIDDVLETNAEEFVRSYVQKGGQ